MCRRDGAECARVLKPGGVLAFTDILRQPTASEADMARLEEEMTFPGLGSFSGYRELLEASGFMLVSVEDLSAEWTRILVDRLAMYRSLKDSTTRKFGGERHEWWDRSYTFFVSLFSAGKLGGGRFLARRAP